MPTARLAALALTLSLLFASPGACLAESAITLGMSAAFSGPVQGLGIELYRGAAAYFEQVNRKGGIGGRRIEVVAYDDRYEPTPALENTIRLVENDGVLCLFNYVGTPTVTRVLPLLKLYHDQSVTLFFPFTGAQPQREAPYDQFVFNLRASYRQETKGLVEKFVELSRRRIAVFYQADAYGRSGWDGVHRALSSLGLEVVGEATYRRGTPYESSMQAQAEIIAQTHPDAVISIGAYPACAAFIRDARNLGLNVPIANLSFVDSENLLKLLTAEGEKTGRDYATRLVNTQVVPSYEDLSLPAAREYRELMDRMRPAPPPGAQQGYEPLRYGFVSFEGFLNAKVMVKILEKLGEHPRREDVARAAESLTSVDIGIGAPISFGPGRHQGLDRIYFTTVRDGKFMPLTDWTGWAK